MKISSILTSLLISAISSSAFAWTGVIAQNNTCNKTFHFTGFYNLNAPSGSFKKACSSGWKVEGHAVVTDNYITLPPGASATCDTFDVANPKYQNHLCFHPENDPPGPPSAQACNEGATAKYPVFETGGNAYDFPDITIIGSNCDNNYHPETPNCQTTPPTQSKPDYGWLPWKLNAKQVPKGIPTCKGDAKSCGATNPQGQAVQPLTCTAQKGKPSSCNGDKDAAPHWAALGAGLELSCGTKYPQPNTATNGDPRSGYPFRCQGKGTMKPGYPEYCGYTKQANGSPSPFPLINAVGTADGCYNGSPLNRSQTFFFPFSPTYDSRNPLACPPNSGSGVTCPVSTSFKQPNLSCEETHIVLYVIPADPNEPEQKVSQGVKCKTQLNTCK